VVAAGEEACRVNLFGWLRRGQRKSSSERLPWYRAPDYSGNLTEAEKRELDASRVQARHPAYQHGELPEHVESYIAGLEIEAYDLKQARAAACALAATLVGAAVLYVTHFGIRPSDSIWDYLIGLAFIILPWFAYRSEWRKNADAFSAHGGILKEWELDHITKARLAAKRRANDPPPTEDDEI
jgi:hypothetical protein